MTNIVPSLLRAIVSAFAPFAPFQRRCARHLACLFAAVALSFSALADSATAPRFQKLDIAEIRGLQVWELLQDRQGFVWIGTNGGLFRHDAYRTERFVHEAGKPASLPDDSITSIYEDPRGRLWIATQHGLARYLPESGGFTTVLPPVGADADPYVRKIIGDGQGGMWLASRQGLRHFDAESGRFTLFANEPFRPDSLAGNNINALARDAQGGLWVALWPAGVDYLAPGAQAFRHFRVDAADKPNAKRNNVRDLLVDSRQRLWLANEAGVMLWHSDSDWSQRRQLPAPAGLGEFRAMRIIEDRQGNIWVSTLENGLLRWDEAGGRFLSYTHHPEDPYSPFSDDPIAIIEARAGMLLIGSRSAGVSKMDPRDNGVERIIPRHIAGGLGKVRNQIMSIAKDGAGHLWLGSTNGLLLFDPASRSVLKAFHHDRQRPDSLSHELIYSLYKAPGGPLWIGTPNGLTRLDRPDGRFTRVRFDKTADNFINRIAPGRDGKLWLSTGGSLISYHPQSGKRTLYLPDANDPDRQAVQPANCLLEDRAGRLWAGSESGRGVDVLDPLTGKFAHYRHDAADPHSLSDDNVLSLFEAGDGSVWVGTGNGINRAIPRASGGFEFRRLAVGTTINAIEPDGDRRFLISTREGISRLDPVSGKLTSFFASDGLLEGFVAQASTRGDDGRLYFGTQVGVTAVRPAALSGDAPPPQVAMTDILVFNRSLHAGPAEGVDLAGAVSDPQALTLSWQNKVLALEFAALDYADPGRNRYAYRLEGFDGDWVMTDAGHRLATYTNLAPGSYLFRVKAANSRGVWNESGVSLPITITPPFWATAWFRLLAALSLLTLLFVAYRWRVRQLLRNQARLEQMVTQRSAEALQARDEAIAASRIKSQFLATMSHEIRTPMNAIVGLAQMMDRAQLSARQRGNLEQIQRSAFVLLGLIGDVLDFSKIEADHIELEAAPFDLDAIFDDLACVAFAHAGSKDLEIVFDPAPEVPRWLVGDSLRLGQILNNLLSNAIKFTERGEVGLQVRLVGAAASSVRLSFSVIDSGIGIPAERLTSIFEPFTQVDSSTTRNYGGTGLGLSISHRLVKLMGGEFRAESILGQGSRFSFTLDLRLAPDQASGLVPDWLGGRRIALCEPNSSARLAMERMLCALGAEVHAGADWQTMRAELAAAPVEITIVSAAVYADALAVGGQQPGKPTIVTVRPGSENELLNAFEGEDGLEYLIKPLTRAALLEALGRLLCLPGAVAADEPAGRNSPLAGRRVLVVEDNAVNRFVLRMMLEQFGLAVEEAFDGNEAMARVAADRPYAAILMDLHMPGIDGLATARAIRARPDGATTPIIAISADAQAEVAAQCREAGIDEHLCKPLQLEILHRSLTRWVCGEACAAPDSASVAVDDDEDIFALNLPGIDVAAVLARLNGSAHALLGLLDRLLLQHGKDPAHLSGHIAAGNLPQALQLGHDLIGVAAMVGATALTKAARRLHEELQSGRENGALARLALEDIVREFARLDESRRLLQAWAARA